MDRMFLSRDVGASRADLFDDKPEKSVNGVWSSRGGTKCESFSAAQCRAAFGMYPNDGQCLERHPDGTWKPVGPVKVTTRIFRGRCNGGPYAMDDRAKEIAEALGIPAGEIHEIELTIVDKGPVKP